VKGHGRKREWLNLRYHAGFVLKDWGKPHKGSWLVRRVTLQIFEPWTCQMRNMCVYHREGAVSGNSLYRFHIIASCSTEFHLFADWLTESLTEINIIPLVALWATTPCSHLIHAYRHFGEMYYLHLLPWRWKQYVPPKRLSTRLVYVVISRKINICIFSDIKSSDLQNSDTGLKSRTSISQ
jgi:hypothetical protein